MSYKSAFLTILSISLLLSACTDNSKVQSADTDTPPGVIKDPPEDSKAA